jgi:multidrug efflux pump subunit AcrA (membrane-fusion protein)
MTRSDKPARPWHLYLLGLVSAVVAALAATDVGPPGSSAARMAREIVTAEDGVVQSTVTGTGNVDAGTDVNVNFQTSGTLETVVVSVGQHVVQGQLLATLDPTSARLTVDQAEESLTAAEDQLTALENGTATSSGAQKTSASASTGTPSSPPAAGTNATTTAAAARTTTTPTITTTTPSPASIASAEAAVYSEEANLHSAQQALAKTSLYAPASGTIVSLAGLSPGDPVSAGSSGTGSGASSTSSGAGAGAGAGASGAGATAGSLVGSSSSSTGAGSSTSFAQIVDASSLTMTVALSESDISKVAVGQPATVTMDALSGVELAAHVSSISTIGTASNGVVSYDATLALDQVDPRVKPGMSASASVIVGQAQGVTVPNQAVTGSGSLATVNVLKNGKTVAQQVVVGLRGDSRTQIISGLNAGEEVVITIALPSLSSTSTTGGTGALGRGLGGFGGGGGLGGGGGGFLRRAAGGG